MIGLVLVLLLAYFFFSYPRLNPDEAIRVAGRLANVPFHGIQGGDFKYHFVRFTLEGRSEKFTVEECSYDRLDHVKLNKLVDGDSLVLFVSADRIENEFDVYGIQTKDQIVLDIANVNDCNSKGWHKTFYLALLICGFWIAKLLLGQISRGFVRSKNERK
jgi:hypothetical protein